MSKPTLEEMLARIRDTKPLYEDEFASYSEELIAKVQDKRTTSDEAWDLIFKGLRFRVASRECRQLLAAIAEEMAMIDRQTQDVYDDRHYADSHYRSRMQALRDRLAAACKGEPTP